jgi:hypothetical protein
VCSFVAIYMKVCEAQEEFAQQMCGKGMRKP